MEAEQERYGTRRRSGTGMRILFLVLVAFAIGAVAMIWVARERPNWLQGHMTGPMGQDPANDAVMGNAAEAETPSALTPPATPLDERAARVAEIEQRLARITLSAQAASYNANRAEALLTAFAARRALDAGRPLGYVEQTLRVRFGDAQPKAVATIVNAAAKPVTLATLRAGLDDIGAVTRQSDPDEGWWDRFTLEVRGMAVLRRAGDPSPEPEQRLARARRGVELGQIDGAIAEMAALPQQARIARWLESARRYNEAHRALDVVEAAAILEPRNSQALEGAPVAADADAAVPAVAAAPAMRSDEAIPPR